MRMEDRGSGHLLGQAFAILPAVKIAASAVDSRAPLADSTELAASLTLMSGSSLPAAHP